MYALSMVLALLVGAGLVVQVALNMAISRATGSALFAALANFLVGTALLTLCLVLSRADWPTRAQLGTVPAWAWLGGALGAAYVAIATFAGPRLGALLLVALTVSGQMMASVIVDHYGLLGFNQQPVTTSHLIGIALLAIGIFLVAR